MLEATLYGAYADCACRRVATSSGLKDSKKGGKSCDDNGPSDSSAEGLIDGVT